MADLRALEPPSVVGRRIQGKEADQAVIKGVVGAGHHPTFKTWAIEENHAGFGLGVGSHDDFVGVVADDARRAGGDDKNDLGVKGPVGVEDGLGQLSFPAADNVALQKIAGDPVGRGRNQHPGGFAFADGRAQVMEGRAATHRAVEDYHGVFNGSGHQKREGHLASVSLPKIPAGSGQKAFPGSGQEGAAAAGGETVAGVQAMVPHGRGRLIVVIDVIHGFTLSPALPAVFVRWVQKPQALGETREVTRSSRSRRPPR